MEKREGNYDLLRIISAVAVIIIHVSATWFANATHDIAAGLPIEDILSPFLLCIYNSLPRFAVPCFVMLSGAFILDDEKNIEYKRFYSKSFSKIGVPAIVFGILYVLYRMPSCFVGEDKGIGTLINLLKSVVIESPMYHMWYLYMLIGLYALAPIVLRFKNSISEKNFYKISYVFLVLASISMWTSYTKFTWDVGYSFEYLGYFMVGYSIRKANREKNNGKAILAVSIGILTELCAVVLRYQQMLGRIELKYSILGPANPLIVLASILIFYGFTVLDVKKDLTKLSSLTLWIYLIHAGVWDFISQVIRLAIGKNVFTKMNGAIWIPVFIIVVFAISCVLSRLYIWLWGRIDKDKRITNRLLRIVHL